jgi:hypothetical protein
MNNPRYVNSTMALENAISMVKSLRRLIICHHDDYEMVKAAVAGHPHIEVKASSLTVEKGRAYIIDPSALEELVDLAMGM